MRQLLFAELASFRISEQAVDAAGDVADVEAERRET
jgi:hypothetical protein